MNDNSLEINTTAIDSICSKYNEIISTLVDDCGNIVNDFKPFLDSGVLSSYIPDLKNNIDEIVLAAKELVNYIAYFSQEQEKIGDNNGGGGGGESSNPDPDNNGRVLSDNNIAVLFSDNNFLNSLLQIVTQYPDILANPSKYELLKELLLKSSTNEDIIKLLNDSDSEVIRNTLYKIINGEIVVQGAEETIEKIKNIILENINSNEITSEVFEGGTYENYTYTASNGEKIDYYLYLPKDIDTREGLPIHLFMWPSRDKGPDGYYNVHGLPCLLRKGQDASGIVICPKLGANEVYSSKKLEALKELTDQFSNRFKCDENRISVSGQGGGGQAAINMATKYPDYFSKVAGLYVSPATDSFDSFASSKEQALENLQSNDVMLIKSRGGGDYLNTRSENYTNKLASKLSGSPNFAVIGNTDPGDLYGNTLYGSEFTYNGKTYTNFLEYMLAQTK